MICDNGDYYNGFWEDNEYNGFGVLAKKNSLFKGFFRKDKKNGYGIKYTLNSEENKTNLILVGNWVENSLEKLALGINSETYKVMCIYMFVNNKLKSTTNDENIIKEKTVNNKECTNLLNFYLEYKDRE